MLEGEERGDVGFEEAVKEEGGAGLFLPLLEGRRVVIEEESVVDISRFVLVGLGFRSNLDPLRVSAELISSRISLSFPPSSRP